MKAVWNGQVVAESDDIVVVEGNSYFPVASLRSEFVKPSSHTSVCSWKGTAHYLSLNVGGAANENAVWFYPEPKDAAANIRGRVAFWKGVQISA
jgi:uncharacterized protein (DUF427 family)